MINSAKSNMYEVNAIATRLLYGDFLQGAQSALVLAASERPLSGEACNALEKSAEALGYGARSVAYLALQPHGAEGRDTKGGATFEQQGGENGLDHRQSTEGETILGPQDVMGVVEGLDPLALVVADERTAQLFGKTYRIELTPDVPNRVFGRKAAVFRDLEKLVCSSDGKQRAWALLKTLKLD